MRKSEPPRTWNTTWTITTARPPHYQIRCARWRNRSMSWSTTLKVVYQMEIVQMICLRNRSSKLSPRSRSSLNRLSARISVTSRARWRTTNPLRKKIAKMVSHKQAALLTSSTALSYP